MAVVYIVPKWFFGYDVALEIMFAIVTLLVSWYAFKVYKLTDHDQPRYVGAGFLFIGLSYFAQSLLNLVLLSGIDFDLYRGQYLQLANFLSVIGLYTHMVFFLVGLIIITYMTLRTKNTATLSLLFALSLVVIFFSTQRVFLFNVLSCVFLAFIAFYYMALYKKKRYTNLLWVLIAFVLLFLASVHFAFAVHHPLLYVIAHIVELVAYLLILTDLILVLRT